MKNEINYKKYTDMNIIYTSLSTFNKNLLTIQDIGYKSVTSMCPIRKYYRELADHLKYLYKHKQDLPLFMRYSKTANTKFMYDVFLDSTVVDVLTCQQISGYFKINRTSVLNVISFLYNINNGAIDPKYRAFEKICSVFKNITNVDLKFIHNEKEIITFDGVFLNNLEENLRYCYTVLLDIIIRSLVLNPSIEDLSSMEGVLEFEEDCDFNESTIQETIKKHFPKLHIIEPVIYEIEEQEEEEEDEQ